MDSLQRIYKPFLAPRSHKNAVPKAKITEPDRIIFLDQDELAPPLFLHTLSVVLFYFIIQNKPIIK
jgi:hypothetical protein